MTAETSTTGVTTPDVLQTTKRVLGKMMRRDPATIKDNAKLFVDLNLKSANVLELLMLVEDELGIQLDPTTLEPRHLDTIGSLSQFIADQAGA